MLISQFSSVVSLSKTTETGAQLTELLGKPVISLVFFRDKPMGFIVGAQEAGAAQDKV